MTDPKYVKGIVAQDETILVSELRPTSFTDRITDNAVTRKGSQVMHNIADQVRETKDNLVHRLEDAKDAMIVNAVTQKETLGHSVQEKRDAVVDKLDAVKRSISEKVHDVKDQLRSEYDKQRAETSLTREEKTDTATGRLLKERNESHQHQSKL